MAASRLTSREVRAEEMNRVDRPDGNDYQEWPDGMNKLAWNRDQHFPHYLLIISQLQPSITSNSHAKSHVFS